MFDLIVVTAANEAQAKGYRAQLKGRKNYIVVPDPGNRRVGSLGATVNVLRKLAKAGRAQGRILICHSGGDSRRTLAKYIHPFDHVRAGAGGDVGTAAQAYVSKEGLCCLGQDGVTAIAVTTAWHK